VDDAADATARRDGLPGRVVASAGREGLLAFKGRRCPVITARKLLHLCLVIVLIGTGPLAALAQAPATIPPPPPPPAEKPHEGAYQTGAVVANVFVAPGRAIICGVGSTGALLVMLLTFGTGYGTAKRVFEEGCVGKWTITADDLRVENQRRGIQDDPYLR
jgi:hypothetical protein